MVAKDSGDGPGGRDGGSQKDETAGSEPADENRAGAIIVTDTEGNIQSVNPEFERVTGYPRVEAVGRNPPALKDTGLHGVPTRSGRAESDADSRERTT